MKEKVVVVTGGSSGMGKAMAAKFAQSEAKVVITGRDEEKLRATKAELLRYHSDIFTVQMDVRKPEDVERMVEETDKKFGHIDFLVNNAAGNFICPAEKLSVNGWNAVINIVLNGTFYCSRAVGNYWIEKRSKGASSIWSRLMPGGRSWRCPFSSGKSGCVILNTYACGGMGKKYGIRVNAIAPGPIERTGGAGKLWESEEAAQRTLNSVPLGRLGTPEEIAELAFFLFSPHAAYINGEVVTMDGGQWLNQHPF